MDFFSAVADPAQPLLHNDCHQQETANESFAEAIANRFGSGALLTTRLTPVSNVPPSLRLSSSSIPAISLSASTPHPPTSPLPSARTYSPSPAQFTTVVPATLGLWTEDPLALILDIRAHAAYCTARLPCAVSLSVPSTLLKRPLFSLHRLADMLPSANARARFSAWRSASRILVYDADSSAIPESSNIFGLLRKFKNDGFRGDLAWLDGGFQAVWREKREIIDAHPPTPDAENEDEDEEADKMSPLQAQASVLRTRHLPMAAFSFSSTTVSNSSSLNPPNPKRGPLSRGATFPALPTPSQSLSQPAFNPFFDAVRQNLELSQGITERIALRLPRRIRHRINDLPFPWLREIARRAAKLAPRNRTTIDSSPSTSEESEDDENATSADVEEGKESLAMQFFRIEVAEQRRLMGIMEHHTKETMIVTSDTGTTLTSNFPYSITAGVEKGAKNRYRHIWPFEHARVRLHQRREGDDDYVNASYVQPIGTNKRYIATQGPLPATFTDFWTLCWEQNVHVIVMLTREVENSMVKCGPYWTESVYGPLRLRLVSTTAASPLSEEPSVFPTQPVTRRHLSSPAAQADHDYQGSRIHRRNISANGIIQRVFELSHTSYPHAPPRKIIHFQYLEWPDMNVPHDPHGILELIKKVNKAVEETQGFEDEPSDGNGSESLLAATTGVDDITGVSGRAFGKNRPVLLHCSAGVGRTGGFIAVDAILDAIRREVKDQARCKVERRDEDVMDVDIPARPPPFIETSSVLVERDDAMSKQTQPVETVLITITAGNHHQKSHEESAGYTLHVPVVHTPSSVGTDPEASGSDRDNASSDIVPSSTFTMKTKAWAEDVSRAESSFTSSLSETNLRQHPQGNPELEFNPLSSSRNTQPDIPSDTSNSSKHSLLDLHHFTNRAHASSSGNYHFPQSSSFATSIAGVSSPEPSPPRLETYAHSSSKDADVPISSMLMPAHHIPTGTASDLTNTSRSPAGDRLQVRSGVKPDKDSTSPQQSSGWLGEPVRNRSPSPMARTASGDSTRLSTNPQKRNRSAKPSFTLRAPPYTGGISSDAEPPSRSVSPSADEGSVASQVSSYHSYLKQHHYIPIHSKSLPINLDKPDKGTGVRSLHIPPPVPERPTLSVDPRPPLGGQSSSSTMTVEHKQPRPLHGTAVPLNLTSLEEPVCEVIQDMREQRMSLCQSLRQYVFVHAAVLEGALMIVDEEKELMKEKEREQMVRMGGSKIESKRQEQVGVVSPQGATSGISNPASGSAKLGGMNMERSARNSNEDPRKAGSPAPGTGLGPKPGHFLDSTDMAVMPETTTCPSFSASMNTTFGNGTHEEGYFASFMSQPPMTCGLGDHEGVGDSGEHAMEGVFSPRPRVPTGVGLVFPPSATSLQQRPRHSLLDARFGKRSTTPSDYFRDGGGGGTLDDDSGLFKRPSVKRKQPSGEAGEITTRKRAQNESSSSRELEKEMQLERRLSNGGSYPHGVLDVLTSGLVR